MGVIHGGLAGGHWRSQGLGSGPVAADLAFESLKGFNMFRLRLLEFHFSGASRSAVVKTGVRSGLTLLMPWLLCGLEGVKGLCIAFWAAQGVLSGEDAPRGGASEHGWGHANSRHECRRDKVHVCSFLMLLQDAFVEFVSVVRWY